MIEGHVRIEVHAWAVIEKVADQYYVRPKSLRFLANYVGKVGIRGVVAKALSRLKEAGRNEKFVAVGLGTVTDSEEGAPAAGSSVAFLATNHPKCVDRIVIHRDLLIPWDFVPAQKDELIFYSLLDLSSFTTPDSIWGWSPYSGDRVDGRKVRTFLEAAARTLERRIRRGEGGERLTVQRTPAVQERVKVHSNRTRSNGKPTAVLFGLGQYAKVHILRNIRSRIDVRKVHEIDPMQVGRKRNVDLDTHPFPRADERFDVYFVAGYHHLHTPIAAAALKRGAYAVVEKPLATTHDQLNEMAEALKGPSRLFLCFHKRYTSFNPLILSDLQIRPGDPVNYACVIHEMPLPERHWYTWPRSAGSIVYNGCNWIDHFFYLNDYVPVRDHWAYRMPSDDIAIVICLENGASCQMTLSAFGSNRAGEREYIEVTTSSGLVRMTNGKRYVSENTHRVLRKARENHMHLYRRMYHKIAERITRGEDGDPARSLASTRCALELHDYVDAAERLAPALRG